MCFLEVLEVAEETSASCDVITSSDIKVAMQRPTSRHWRSGSGLGSGPGPETGDGLSSKKTNLQQTVVVTQQDYIHSGSVGLQCLWLQPPSGEVTLRHHHHHHTEGSMDVGRMRGLLLEGWMMDGCWIISVISSRTSGWSVKQCLVSGGPGRRGSEASR